MAEIKQPKIRFKGHINDWEQRKLGEHANILAGGTPKTQIKEYWEPKEIPWMSSGEINKKRLYETDNKISEKGLNNSNTRWVKENSVLIALAGQGKTRGTVAVNEIKLTTNQSIAAIETGNELNYEFLFQHLEKRYDELRLLSSGDGSRGGLNKKIISDLFILSPSIHEQQKIGIFFKVLDATIALNQQKLEVTKQFKQTMLKKMFPKNGETTPEIRFKGFTDDWEECKLGDVIEEYSELQAQSIDYPLVSFTSENGVTPKTERYNREQLVVGEASSKKYKKTEYNDIVYNPANLKFGAIARNTYGKSVFSPIYVTFKVISNNVYPEFIESIVTRKDFINYSLKFEEGTVYERKSVKPKDFLNINCRIPSSREQRMVGKYFESLDNQIINIQNKLNNLNYFKKTILNKLFI